MSSWMSNVPDVTRNLSIEFGGTGTSNVLDPIFKVSRVFQRMKRSGKYTNLCRIHTFFCALLVVGRVDSSVTAESTRPTIKKYTKRISFFKVNPPKKCGSTGRLYQQIHRVAERPSYSIKCWVKTDDKASGWPAFYTARNKVTPREKKSGPARKE